MSERNAINPDIPTDRAWKVGRRIYVVASYNSPLNAQLREIGAKWDADERALWVGSGKLGQVLPLLRAREERKATVEAVLSAGRYVTIPYEATGVRQRAKQLGAVWDPGRKDWAMPSAESLADIRAAVAAWRGAQAQAERAQLAALAESDRADRVDRATRAEATLIAESGRTVTEVRGTADGRLHGRLKRHDAERRKPQPGSVRRLRDGRRVLVLTSEVEFVSQDAIDDGMSHGGTSDEPGWYFSYRFAVVEPTDAEQADDGREAAERADTVAIHAAFEAAAAAVQDRSESGTRVEGPSIVSVARAGGLLDGYAGTLTLADGVLHWCHPGYYDDWRATFGVVTDEAIVAQVRAIVAGGQRRRYVEGDVLGRGYEVRP